MFHTILLGLTTTPRSDWRAKIKEIDQLELTQIAAFPTCLKLEERKECYDLLQKTNLKHIPHVHLRDDMEKWELDFFAEQYGTELFNIHAVPTALKFLEWPEYREKIFIENTYNLNDLFYENLKNCGGLCLDASHYEDYVVLQKLSHHQDLKKCLDKVPIGCCHISAVNIETPETGIDERKKEFKIYSKHYLDDLPELDYVKKYARYFPKYVSIELENTFAEQLEIAGYLGKLLELRA